MSCTVRKLTNHSPGSVTDTDTEVGIPSTEKYRIPKKIPEKTINRLSVFQFCNNSPPRDQSLCPLHGRQLRQSESFPVPRSVNSVISPLNQYDYSIIHAVPLGPCESEIFVRIESRIESAATIRIRIESRIESGCSRFRLRVQCRLPQCVDSPGSSNYFTIASTVLASV